ncbi:hypothetical protein BN946_scf184696.g3 [Trametes cinnabarina]|uniref:R3H domain-containing protein n=1 Tax=Pycnoporus cinnabarinus TaxID=5643 RepID=A0A060SPE7_PYCCI|nr:hypothetical protein BN946_scf184696.g3 [Trametes cinnabarina]
MPGSGASTPRYAFPTYGKGRGLGRGEPVAADNLQRTYGFGRNLASKLQAGAPLSKVLYEDRPLLKPIIFVRSVHNPTLFQEEEDIFKPVVEPAVDGDEKSHVPTADAVSRVFNPNADAFDDSEADEEELEEIDFADIGRLQAEVDAAAAVTDTTATQPITVNEQTTFFVDITPAPIRLNKKPERIAVNKLDGALGQAADDDEVIVYVAPHPRPTRARTPQQDAPATVDTIPSTSILTGLAGGSDASTARASPPTEERSTVVLELGTLYPEEPSSVQEQMSVSLGPDPSELPPPPSFDNMSFAFEKTAARKQTRRLHPVGTPRSLLKRSRKARRKSLRGFGAYGAMHEEAQLHDVDPRCDEQRRGDSDVNWGDSDEDDAVEELSTGVADMEIDENVSLAAMKRFVHSMSAEGSQHVTMDDVADIARIKVEDEEEKTRGAESAEEEDDSERAEEHLAIPEDVGLESESESETEDEEVEAIFRAEEAELVGESDHNGAQIRGVRDAGDDEDDEDEDDESAEESSDDEETPKRGFQARLERLRASTGKGKGRAAVSFSDDESSDDAMSVQMTWADEDEDFFDSIEVLPHPLLCTLGLTTLPQAILEENQDILLPRDRKSKKKLFTAIRDGTFERDMFTDMMTPAKRGKTRDVPDELREQWEKDRAKKAENKRKRAEDRMKVAADPLAHHRGGKKGRKAMLAAARAAADADLPNRITDFVSLEQQIRRFLADIGGPQIMSLPPADKETRKRVHELATAFNLKSQSKGSGDSRYTTLTKTSRSGIGINERKIRRILKQATNGAWEGPETGKSGRSKAMSLAKHREGEEVGKASYPRNFVRKHTLTTPVYRRLQRSARQTSASRCWPLWVGPMETV